MIVRVADHDRALARVWIAGWVTACVLTGCGSAPRAAVASAIDARDAAGAIRAYERVRASDGPDAELLGSIAALILEEEARGDDPELRRAAIQELMAAGTAALPTLRRLAEGEPAQVPVLEALAAVGDEPAQLLLRALADHPDADVRAAAVLGMTVEHDRALLIEALDWPVARAREHAATRLAGAAPESAARVALEQTSRVDPSPAVRSRAVRSLASWGALAIHALRERLSDPDVSVRMSAVAALVRVDGAAAATLGSLLAAPPSAQGIEAARLLASRDRGDTASRAFLRQALLARDAALRAQAAVALSSLPEPGELVAAIREALEREIDPSSRLALAMTLLGTGEDQAGRAALRAMAVAGPSMHALQAAAVLAATESSAAEALSVYLASEDPALRRSAARALAREAMRPDAAIAGLVDPDPRVRIAAAGGVLAAASASR